jgi:ABC-type Fe3+-hydroxamate transport system substrate-binding protein
MVVSRRFAAALLIATLFSGRAAAAAPAHPRIVALVPSLVEDLFAIGAGSQVVGVSVYSGNVPGAAHLPVVADFSSVDAEKIVALRPDAVIGIPAQARLVAPLKRAGIRVVLVSDDSYADIFTDLTVAGAISGHRRAAAALIAKLQRQTARLRAQTRGFKRRPSVFVALGTGPVWTVGPGSYIATLVRLAGGRNAAGDLGAPYGEYSAEALLRDQPDAIVTDPSVHLQQMLGNEPWRSLRAVSLHRVYVVERASILERPGPYYNEGLQWLIERLAPLAR